MFLLALYLTLALGCSFLCSLLESVLLSVPRSHVALLIEQGSPAGRRLRKMKDDIDQPLAAILILNTFAHTLGAAGVGAQAAILWGDASVGLVSFAATLLILIFSEIIPKTLGAVHAKSLAPFASRTISLLITILRPVVAICNWISLLFSGKKQSMQTLSRDEVRTLAQLALEGGAIDHAEAAVLRNLIALREITVKEVMTPRPVVFALPADHTVEAAVATKPPRFARIPLFESSLDNPKGLVHRQDLLRAMSESRADTPLSKLARPLHIVPDHARLPIILQDFLRRREQLFLVVDEHGRCVGIITLEDVIETLLGVEIVDETDPVVDMQRLARQMLKRRQRSALDT